MMSTNSEHEEHTLTVKVSSRSETNQRILRAFQGEAQGSLITFESPILLFEILTRKRWELLAIMTGAGSISIGELAHRLDRDIKAVQEDIITLRDAGFLKLTSDGEIVFPFDAVHVDFMLKAA